MKKQILTALLVLFSLSTPFFAKALSPYQKYAILNYTENIPGTAIYDWMLSRFDFMVAGNSTTIINPQPSGPVKWVTYYNIYGPSSISEWMKVKDWADSKAVVAEDVLLHYNIDYTSVNSSWVQMDKFDNFEGANGVLLETEGVFTDKTAISYSGASPYTTINQTLYIGYEEPFDQANFNLRTAAVSLVGAWQYWNGYEWSTLTATDDTFSLTTTGRLSFIPPADWSRTIVNGSRNKYFIRFAYVSSVAAPVINTIKGDTWLTNASAASCRGWNSTDSNRVNIGTRLEYNPTPPAGASAKFPYQARIAYWDANRFVANPADMQTIDGISKRTWSQFLAFRVGQVINAISADGVMGDDGQRSPLNEGLLLPNAGYVDLAAWAMENLAKYTDFVNTLHSTNPTAIVGLNGQDKSFVLAGDWNLFEYESATYQTGGGDGNGNISVGTTSMHYDDYLPVNNPAGKKALMIFGDVMEIVPYKTAVWDQSNRGPIVALSKHLIGANENTYFSYHSYPGFVYHDTDEVVLTNGSTVRMATQYVPTVSEVKRWGTWFPAMGVDMGIPDVNGWNGGVRNFSWMLGVNIGGGANVWRRDYTNAIVLHRPAMWNTTDSAYNTPSLPMDLDGTYYPLYADATTGSAITSVALKHGEGAILMKEPLGIFDMTAPSAPYGLSVL